MTVLRERKHHYLPILLFHADDCDSSLYFDGFWSRGIGNEGTIRITDEDGA